MASSVSIANRALQHLGSKSIVSLTEDSKSARELNRAFADVRDREIEAHPWNFAKRRVKLPALSDAPVFGYTTAYQVPADCIKPLRTIDSPEWSFEGGKILTDQKLELDLLYLAKVTDANLMNALFREVFALALAVDLAETFTQSQSKKEWLERLYTKEIRKAKRENAISNPAKKLPQTEWLTERY